MNEVLSIRLPARQKRKVVALARAERRSTSEVGARLIDEALRLREFLQIEFRDTPTGRTAFVRGTRTPVWMVAHLVRQYHGRVNKAAAHLRWREDQVREALCYAEAYADEMAAALQLAEDSQRLTRLVPWAKTFVAKP